MKKYLKFSSLVDLLLAEIGRTFVLNSRSTVSSPCDLEWTEEESECM